MENTAQTLWDSCADAIRSQVSDIVWQMNFHSAQPTEVLDNELIPFKSACDVGIKSLMVGHILFPNIISDKKTYIKLIQSIINDTDCVNKLFK